MLLSDIFSITENEKNVIKRSKIWRNSPERQIRAAVQPIGMTGNRSFLTGTQREVIVNYAKCMKQR